MTDQADVLKRLEERAAAAIKRVIDGHGCMRVPADPTDPDLVISDLLNLTRSLLESQGELSELLVSALSPKTERGRRLLVVKSGPALARAEKVRKGEV